jgi:hypothetical protein
MEKAIQKYYLDPKTGLMGLKTFVAKYRKLYPEISAKQIRNAVQKLHAYSLHQETRHGLIKRRSYVIVSEFHLWSADLCFLPKLKQWNDGVQVFLVVKDCFSKRVWIEPLRNKSSTATAGAFEKILRETHPEKPLNITFDQGGEFMGAPFKRLLKRYEINSYLALSSPHKAAHSEAAIKLFKSKVFRLLTSKQTFRYIDEVSSIVHNMNTTVSRTHNMRPIDVNRSNSHAVFKKMYSKYFQYVEQYKRKLQEREKKKDDELILPPGTKVRISIEKGVFEPGYTRRWKREQFVVSRVKNTVPHTYVIKDGKGEILRGVFYRQELQPIKS